MTPFIPIRSYLECLAACNPSRIPRESRWLFYPGMLFGSRAKWWGDFSTRASCHEGLDICWFSSGQGPAKGLDPEIQVPAMAGGRLMTVCRDFLGQSMLVENEHLGGPEWRTVIIYSHVAADPGLAIGDTIRPGQRIATLADTSGRSSGIPCHLHLSVMEIHAHLPEDQLHWAFFVKSGPDLLKWYNPAMGF